MTADATQHPWSSEALFNKALLYVGEMERNPANEWQFSFWSSLSLELLARAALAHISPTLLANRSEWRNIYYALGYPATAKRFSPTSAATTEILTILREIQTDFTQELADFCLTHCARRNADLHSGEEVFVGLGTSAWLAKYYASCEVFLKAMGKTLDDLFVDTKTAAEMITSLQDTASKAVRKDIEAYKQVWEHKNPEEQKKYQAQATAWATRHAGHRAICPACGNTGLIHGSSQGAVSTTLGEEDVIVQKQMMLPSAFECIACGLKITGLSKLSACNLGDAFTATSTLSAAEFFGLHTDEELEEARAEFPEPDWEEDSNE